MHYIHDVCRLWLLQTNPQIFVSLKCKFPLNFIVFTMLCLFWCYNLSHSSTWTFHPKSRPLRVFGCMPGFSVYSLLTLLGIVDILHKDGISFRTRLGRSIWFSLEKNGWRTKRRPMFLLDWELFEFLFNAMIETLTWLWDSKSFGALKHYLGKNSLSLAG